MCQQHLPWYIPVAVEGGRPYQCLGGVAARLTAISLSHAREWQADTTHKTLKRLYVISAEIERTGIANITSDRLFDLTKNTLPLHWTRKDITIEGLVISHLVYLLLP